ncbi:MAG TPA: glycosyltransferase [Flavobacteriaceae bacterium]|nr:glycosyltransferase [Flavobacteriaceae bacterium]
MTPLLALLITAIYALCMIIFGIGFNRIPTFKTKQTKTKTRFSILIPFRNEEKNLPQMLSAIAALNYPEEAFEALFINDASTDHSVKIIENFSANSSLDVKILETERVSVAPKKDALTTGVKHAKNPWILTTDADCIVPELWLTYFDSYIQENNPNVICGPVKYLQKNTFLSRFQEFELLSLMSITLGAFGLKTPFMCNGANLGFKKSLFLQINGYRNNNHIASGDDVFLLESALSISKTKVHVLKSDAAAVSTSPEKTWHNIVQQRIRWASKAASTKSSINKIVGLVVLLMNVLLVCLTPLVLTQKINLFFALGIFAVKLILDYRIITKSAVLFNSKIQTHTYLISGILYPFFSTFIAAYSFFMPYKWKDRRFFK